MSKLTYTRCGDYYIPDLKLSEQPEAPIGKYGRMRQRYLKEHRPGFYSSLILSEKLYPHLLEIDRAARERMDAMLPCMMEAAGVTEELKARDPMRWVGLMNTLKAQAEACVLLTQKRNEKDYEFEIEVSLMIDSDRLFEDSRPTYTNIRKYVFDKYGVKLQLKDIADVKRDYGMKMKVNKHLIKGDEPVRRKCTPNKRKYIIEALKYYHAI